MPTGTMHTPVGAGGCVYLICANHSNCNDIKIAKGRQPFGRLQA